MTDLKDFLEATQFVNEPTKAELFQQTMLDIIKNVDPKNHKLAHASLRMSDMLREMIELAASETKQQPQGMYN